MLENVNGGNGQWSARCPAHEDNHASLSISISENGKILLNCHAGCDVSKISNALGLSVSELFAANTGKSQAKSNIVATYEYKDSSGAVVAKKIRYSNKGFCWLKPDDHGGWSKGRSAIPPLYNEYHAKEAESVYIVEGEKDVDTLTRLGKMAVSLPDGAQSKWIKQYTDFFKGRSVAIIQDNDNPGKAFAQMVAGQLQGSAASVKIIDLSEIWQDMPEKADISDYLQRFPEGMPTVSALVKDVPEWSADIVKTNNSVWDLFKTLDQFEEKNAEWVVPAWIPKGQITLLAADGGVGKTTLWCHIIAAISSGKRCILDPPDYIRQPAKIVFITTEDSVRIKLRQKIREAGANMKNIITPDFAADKSGELRNLKFGTPFMEDFIKHFPSAACIFDPVQGFLPPKINMGSRNDMRDCMSPLIPLGEEYGTAFIVVCHTNKRKGAYGRDRIADSADLWDIARSVIMSGYTEEQGTRYLSNEKNNYAPLQETILFTITDKGQIEKSGTSWKRDREYQQDTVIANSAPKRDDCKQFIMKTLRETPYNSMPTAELDAKAKAAGYSLITLKRAKAELSANSAIKFFQTGSSHGKTKIWNIKAVETENNPPPLDILK